MYHKGGRKVLQGLKNPYMLNLENLEKDLFLNNGFESSNVL